ncbi:origin recognition complex subunit 3, partial [Tanacetum coccineum]
MFNLSISSSFQAAAASIPLSNFCLKIPSNRHSLSTVTSFVDSSCILVISLVKSRCDMIFQFDPSILMLRLLVFLLRITTYGSDLLIILAYAPSMPPLLSLPLFMACDDSDGCVTMAFKSCPSQIATVSINIQKGYSGTSNRYTFAQEHGDLINLHDWFQSFKAITLQKTVKERQRMKVSPSPKKRKMTAEPQ